MNEYTIHIISGLGDRIAEMPFVGTYDKAIIAGKMWAASADFINNESLSVEVDLDNVEDADLYGIDDYAEYPEW